MQDLPDKLMLCKVAFCHQITFIAWNVLLKNIFTVRLGCSGQLQNSCSNMHSLTYKYHNFTTKMKSTCSCKNRKFLTSQLPIFKIFAWKFEAFIRSPAVEALDFTSFFLVVSEVLLHTPNCSPADFAWESLIWIRSSRDGLFLSRRPNGLGSSSTSQDMSCSHVVNRVWIKGLCSLDPKRADNT